MRETWGGAISATDVVGRDAELAAVAAFLDVVRSGPCGVVLEGEAGIGKTAIWRVGAASAADRPFTVLSKRLISCRRSCLMTGRTTGPVTAPAELA